MTTPGDFTNRMCYVILALAVKLRASWPRTTPITTAPARHSPAAVSRASAPWSPKHLAASRAEEGSSRACQRQPSPPAQLAPRGHSSISFYDQNRGKSVLFLFFGNDVCK